MRNVLDDYWYFIDSVVIRVHLPYHWRIYTYSIFGGNYFNYCPFVARFFKIERHVNQFHSKDFYIKIKTLLISASDGRFPRAWLQPPRYVLFGTPKMKSVPNGRLPLQST
jgi:hypothetical protein